MAFLLTLLLLAILAATVALLRNEGMWGNGIRLVITVMAGLVATNFWEPLAAMIEGMAGGSYSFVYDFVSLWLLFMLTFFVLKLITDKISRNKVRFAGMADTIGGLVFGALVGYVLVAFTLMTLHTAPLAQKSFFGGFDPASRMFFGLAPDRQWLTFVAALSRGAYSSASAAETGGFDPEQEFINTYRKRRQSVEAAVQSSGTIKPTGGIVAKR